MPAFPGRGLFLDMIMAQAVTVEPGVPVDLSNAFIFYDSRNYCGNGVMVNEGTGGSLWDMLVEQPSLFSLWGHKRLNYGANPDVGGPWPTTAADIGGDSCTGMLQITAIPNAVLDPSANIWAECEWILQQDQTPFDLFAYWGVYIDNFSALDTIDGNIWTYLDDYANYMYWQPEREYDPATYGGATGISPVGVCLIAQWVDVVTQEARVWVVDQRGVNLVASGSGAVSGDGTFDSEFGAACGTVGFPGEGSNALEMFWSMSYHTGWRSAATRTQWNGVIGQGLWRTGPPTEASLSALFDYFNDGPQLSLQSDGFGSISPTAIAMNLNGLADQTVIYTVENNIFRMIGITPPTYPAVLGSLFNGALAGAVDVTAALDLVETGRALVATPTQLVSVRTTNPASMYVEATKTDATVLSSPTHCEYANQTGQYMVTGGNGYLVEVALLTASISITNSLACNAVGRPDSMYNGVAGGYYMVPHSSGGLNVVHRNTFTLSDSLVDADMTGATEVVAKVISFPEAYAFVACPSTGKVVVVDVSDPTNIVKSNVISGLSSPHELQVWGSTLIIPGDGVIYFYDISDPTNPTLQTTETSLGHGANDGSAIWGDFFVMASGQVYSLVGEAVPLAQVDRITDGDLLQTARGIDVYGDYLFVVGPLADINQDGSNLGGLTVIDKSNPSAMSIVGSLVLADAWDIAITDNGQRAYVTGQAFNCVYSVDISTPTAPVLDDTLTDATLLDRALGIRLTGNYAVCTVQDRQRVTVVNISNPSAMSIEGSVSDVTNLQTPNDLVLSADGNIAYVSCNIRVTAVDISIKSAPFVMGSYAISVSGAENIVIDDSGRYVYVANNFNANVLVLDVLNPYSISLATTVPGGPFGGGPGAAFVYEDRLWFGGGIDQGVQAYDISDPADPKLIALVGAVDLDTFDSYGMVYDPADGHLYTTSYGPDTVIAYDTVDQCARPAIPAYNSLTLCGSKTDTFYLDNASNIIGLDSTHVATVETGGTEDHFCIWDISNLSNITLVGQTSNLDGFGQFQGPQNMARYGSDYVVVDNGVYLGSFHVVDISNFASPTIVGLAQDATNFFTGNCGVAIQGSNAFVTGNSQFGTISLTTPASPSFTNVTTITTIVNPPTVATGLTGRRPSVPIGANYVAIGGTLNLIILNVSNPNSPSVQAIVTDTIFTDNVDGLDVSPSGQYLSVLATDDSVLSVYNVTNVSSPTREGSVRVPIGATVKDACWVTENHIVVIGGASGSGTIYLIDVTDKTSPTIVTSAFPGGTNLWRVGRISDDKIGVVDAVTDTLYIYCLDVA